MRIFKSVLVLLILMFSTQVFAQPGPNGEPRMREKMKERIKTLKIWKLTEEVDLTSDQSEKFFPIYKDFQKGLMELEEKRFRLLRELDELSNADDVNDQSLKNKMDEIEAIHDDHKKLHTAFLKDTGSILSVKQQARLLIFEERFKNRMHETINDIRRDSGKRRRMKDGP